MHAPLARFWRKSCLALAAFLLLCATPSAARAAEQWKIGDKIYSKVVVREVTDGSVTIFHSGGIQQFDLATLPPAFQKRFGYDPEKYDEWKRSAGSALVASIELQRRALARREKETLSTRQDNASAPPRVPGFSSVSSQVEYRASVDLRPVYRQNGLFLKDQGHRPSCSVFAVVSALEYELARANGTSQPLSEEFLVWAVRQLQPGIPIDDGYHFDEVIAALQCYGVPLQSIMPNTFGKRVTDIEPTVDAINSALTRRNVVPIWFRREDPRLIERMVDALNRGHPVVIGVRWPNWRAIERNPLLRDQKPLEDQGHAVTLVGYTCQDGNGDNLLFIFRNSWGVSWGNGGCGLIAPGYLRENLITAFQLTVPGAEAPPPFATP